MSDTKEAPPPYPGSQAPYPPQQTPYPPQQSPYPPPPAGGYPPPQPGFQTAPVNVYTQPQPQTTTTVVVAGRGNCPNCRVGNLVETFTCCGIVLAILFFPLGLLCCLLMRARVCTHCHAHF